MATPHTAAVHLIGHVSC